MAAGGVVQKEGMAAVWYRYRWLRRKEWKEGTAVGGVVQKEHRYRRKGAGRRRKQQWLSR